MGQYRSENWFGRRDVDGFLHRAWVRTEGFTNEVFQGRPVIGISNSWSELTNCNVHLRLVAEAVKRGVWQAGGFPLEFPTMSLGEALMKPTAMLYRNLMSMDVEETIRANPIDGVVMLAGCDKTVPANLMGAASCNVPALMITGGPMLNGHWRDKEVGVTDAWKINEELRAGRMTEEQVQEVESCLGRSAGHCMVMGTASTMACMVEALGMTLPGGAAIPAADSRRYQIAEAAGRQIVALVKDNIRPSDVLTRQAFENAIRVLHCISGSTNAVIHLIAIAGRIGVELPLSLFDDLSRDTPWLVNLKPAGAFMMEDFFYAGGLPAMMREIPDLLHLDALTVSGKTLRENIANAETVNREVIAARDKALRSDGGLVVLRGNICPNGAILKQTAATERLLQHEGRAVVFEDFEELHRLVDDPALDIDENSIMVLKNAGPKGAPGMPEWGHLPIPKKLLQRGVMDLIRISDARMSGTAYGTAILHVSPESALGGPLAAVRTGDRIELDVRERRLTLKVEDSEIRRRLGEWRPRPPRYTRGYGQMFLKHVLQAEEGCDFDFLRGRSEVETATQTYG
jgi:dihydroxy-acid dehydratase